MWSTFHETDYGQDPIHPLNMPELIGRLGVEHQMMLQEFGISSPGGPLVCVYAVLRYTLPNTTMPHVPTIVEAYAGTMNYFFRVSDFKPAAQPDKLPRTHPTGLFGNQTGLPEIVHSVITASQLSTAIQMEFVQ